MLRRIFLKTLIIFVLINLPQIHSTNAYFTDTAVASENIFTVDDWTPPESSVTDNQPDYQNAISFEVDYTASDSGGGVKEVQLYYSYEGGNWQLFGTDIVIDGKFIFTSPQGDGFYEFKTVAFDNAGNKEDEDGNNIGDSQDLVTPPVFLFADAFTTIDTTPPVTMLSSSDTMAVANEFLHNSGFENGNLDDWTIDSNGGDHQVTTEDKKIGAYSALIGFKTAVPLVEPAFDLIKQNVSLPSLITSTLSFQYRLVTNNTASGGFFEAIVKHGPEEIKVAHDGWDNPEVLEEDLGWKNVTYQLNGLEGENIEVQFKVTQPYEGYRAWAYLDDVKLTAATNLATTTTQLFLSGNDGAGSDNLTISYTLDNNPPAIYFGVPITLSTPGEHTLKYFSTDEAGNIEPGIKVIHLEITL